MPRQGQAQGFRGPSPGMQCDLAIAEALTQETCFRPGGGDVGVTPATGSWHQHEEAAGGTAPCAVHSSGLSAGSQAGTSTVIGVKPWGSWE